MGNKSLFIKNELQISRKVVWVALLYWIALTSNMFFQAFGGNNGSFYFTKDTLFDSFVINEENEGYSNEKINVFYRDMTIPDTIYTWNMTMLQWSSAWVIFFCDPNRCNDPIARQGDFVMKNSEGSLIDSAKFEIGVNTNKEPGYAEVKITVYPKTQPTKTTNFIYMVVAKPDSMPVIKKFYIPSSHSIKLIHYGNIAMLKLAGWKEPIFAELLDIKGRRLDGFVLKDKSTGIILLRPNTNCSYIVRVVINNSSFIIPFFKMK